ncbi:CU044_5270 family protein [Arthrobacter sp. zg-Y1143]|uniref:CU044_5270 family protein n=1 Tax=Arthrobacter sp. zg-Y1143 TaxID=3049065 RepID=UPI0024C38134|nr:CU044_5270 family protein [Arthrobacter sp. zg-Y1143]MDK1326301.1 CU044_5270 family protein [Arthrobacter sp. zg-Y1143]
MDELHLLRATRNTTGTVPPAVLAAGREKLMQRTAEEDSAREPAPVLHPRRPWRRALLASAAAAALVAALVAVDVVGSDERPGATAEAAEVLNAAAAATITSSDPVLAPGQYLLVDTDMVGTTSTVTPEGQEFSWLTRRDHQVYIPADRSGEWVWIREPSKPVQFFDEGSRQEAERVGAGSSDSGDVSRAPRGEFGGSTQHVLNDMPLQEAVEGAPRDPRQLLDLLYEGNAGGGQTPHEEAFERIAETLGTGAIPADLRAALYQAAALIPGVSVVDREAALAGRTGISLGIGSPEQGYRSEIIIDPQTGLMIGERTVLLEDGKIFPAGTALGWSAVTTSVVDSAP